MGWGGLEEDDLLLLRVERALLEWKGKERKARGNILSSLVDSYFWLLIIDRWDRGKWDVIRVVKLKGVDWGVGE